MTHPENGKTLWTEARVAALLEDFFDHEIPPSLREEAPPRNGQRESASAPTAQIRPPRTRNGSMAGIASIGFSSLLMLMLAFLIMEGGNSPSRNPGGEHELRLPGKDSAARGVSHERDPIDALNHDGTGPVELRPHIRPVLQGEPDKAGENPRFPELEIEVFPLDREPAEEQTPQDSLPESQDPDDDLPRLPEEDRQLPESQSPLPPDPDEAALY